MPATRFGDTACGQGYILRDIKRGFLASFVYLEPPDESEQRAVCGDEAVNRGWVRVVPVVLGTSRPELYPMMDLLDHYEPPPVPQTNPDYLITCDPSDQSVVRFRYRVRGEGTVVNPGEPGYVPPAK